jgi:hypothetical protein
MVVLLCRILGFAQFQIVSKQNHIMQCTTIGSKANVTLISGKYSFESDVQVLQNYTIVIFHRN